MCILGSAGAGAAPANLPWTEQWDGSRTSISPTQSPNAAHTSHFRVGERVRVDTEDGKLLGVIKHVLDASHYRSSCLHTRVPAADLLLTAYCCGRVHFNDDALTDGETWSDNDIEMATQIPARLQPPRELDIMASHSTTTTTTTGI